MIRPARRRAGGWISRMLLASLLACAVAGGGLAAPAPQGPRTIGQIRPDRPPRRTERGNPPIQEIVEGFFVSRFQRELDLDDGQFASVLPALRESLERRTQLGQRRARALNELRRSLQEGASDETLEARIDEVDAADRALRAVNEDLFRAADPELSPRQRAQMRILLPNLEQRIRNLIERSRNRPPPGD